VSVPGGEPAIELGYASEATHQRRNDAGVHDAVLAVRTPAFKFHRPVASFTPALLLALAPVERATVHAFPKLAVRHLPFRITPPSVARGGA